MLRFAVLLAVGLAAAAALILVFVRHADTAQAERSAISRARFATEAVVKSALRPPDLTAPVSGSRRRELDAVFSRLLLDGTMRVAVLTAGGRTAYSTDHRLIGTRAGALERLQEALRGQVVSSVEPAAAGDGTTRMLVTLVPVVLGAERERGVVAFEQDYAPIATAANDAVLPIAGVLEVLLVLFFAVFLPVLARVSWRIRRHIDELEHVATHDELTGLPNRLGFQRALAAAVVTDADDELPGVLVLDLDGFKEVNDALGHDAGDRLLLLMGERLEASAPVGSAVARLGADEFGVLLQGADESAALGVAAAMKQAVAAPLVVDGVRLSLDASVGVATAAPADGMAGESLLRRAGVALHLAKERRSGIVAYDAGEDGSDASRLALTAELREAIRTGALSVHYQAQSEVRTGSVRGVEALVRWEHPVHGMMPPSAFVPLAERAGLVAQLGRFVLAETVRQWREWSDRGLDLDVSVNLTTADLLDLSLPDAVLGLLEQHAMPPARLVLEITESTLMGDERRTLDVLGRLRSVGVRIAIDDFGTGYSSLGYLSRLPVDEVKIDRSFVTGLPADAGSSSIVRLTVELARTFGLCVVAEGVETAEQLEHLAGLGCDVAQGYLIGRPVPAEALTQRLAPPRAGRGRAGRPGALAT